MGNLWVGLTDNDWFDAVSRVPAIDEVNKMGNSRNKDFEYGAS
jgi:hypothetical protein